METTLGDAVLDAGAKLFSEYGWENTTMESVAVEAKQPAAEVLQRFPSREYLARGIFEAVLKRTAVELADEVDTESTLQARLYALVANQLRPLEPYKSFVYELLMQAMVPLSPAALLQAPVIARYLALASEQIQIARARGEIYLFVIPSVAALAYWAIHMQIIWYWLNDTSEGSQSTHAVVDRWIGRFIRTLGGGPATIDQMV